MPNTKKCVKILVVVLREELIMKTLENIVTFIQVIIGIIVVVLVLLQQGKDDGNIISGSSNRGGSMGSSKETRLANLTKIMGIAYILFTIASGSLMLINR